MRRYTESGPLVFDLCLGKDAIGKVCLSENEHSIFIGCTKDSGRVREMKSSLSYELASQVLNTDSDINEGECVYSAARSFLAFWRQHSGKKVQLRSRPDQILRPIRFFPNHIKTFIPQYYLDINLYDLARNVY